MVVTFYEVVYIEFRNSEPSAGDMCNPIQLKCLPLCMSVNDHESSMCIDFTIRNKFYQAGKFTNMESANDENLLYSVSFHAKPMMSFTEKAITLSIHLIQYWFPLLLTIIADPNLPSQPFHYLEKPSRVIPILILEWETTWKSQDCRLDW